MKKIPLEKQQYMRERRREQSKAERAYFHAVGAFIHHYARVEFILHVNFSYFARIHASVAAAIKRSMKAKELIAIIRPLLTINKFSDMEIAIVENCFDHFLLIAEFRDRVIHRGAAYSREGMFSSDNFATMHSLESFEHTTFTVKDIRDATSDLKNICNRISAVCASAPPEVFSKTIRDGLTSPWRYKPVKLKRPHQLSRPKPQTPERQQKSSGE